MGPAAAHEVCRYDLLVSPVQDALHGAGSSLLDGRHDLIVLSWLLQTASQVHHRDIRRRDAESHACELAIDSGQALADGLGGASARWNYVLRGTAATAPILAAAARAIHCKLSGGHG